MYPLKLMMAVFTRLFSPKKSKNDDKFITTPGKNQLKELKILNFSLQKADVRIVLFRECDWRGRKLLFDSMSVEKVSLDPKTTLTSCGSNSSDLIVEISKGYGYKYKKPHPDTNTLGETIFGSIAMVSRGPSIKVHLMKDPARIMFTKVIQAPQSGVKRHLIGDEKILDDSQSSSFNSSCDCSDSKQGSFELNLDDVGFGCDHDSSTVLNSDWLKYYHLQTCSCTSHCPIHPSSFSHNIEDSVQANSRSSFQSGSSLSSLRKRWARSVTTTLDFTDSSKALPSTGKRTKLGIALIIPLMPSNSQDMEQFLLDRLPLMNNILTRLQDSIEQAYCHKGIFVQSMFQASIHATQSVYQLICGSRLDLPLWLTLTSDRTNSVTKTDMASKLVSDLCHLLATIDTKHTNFFISTLLTAVLTHHLGWVPTVFSDVPIQSDTMLADLSRNHPYNPLWAQLSDLQGVLGHPPKIAKTIVVGKSEILVQKLLSILSYFIRCSEVNVSDLQREVLPDEEDHLTSLLENKLDKISFDKDAIREFSTAGSFEKTMSSSTSTLTKSKTVLSMKTFSMTDCEMDIGDSLESSFESCNKLFEERYDGENKAIKQSKNLKYRAGKNTSCAKLAETSFSQSLDTVLNDTVQSESKTLTPVLPSQSSVVQIIESDNRNVPKIESEKQFSAARVFDSFNQIDSKFSCNNDKSNFSHSIKENLFQPITTTVKNNENKVVFVLGENEELINIKGTNLLETFKEHTKFRSNAVNFEPPTILIDHQDLEYPDISGERFKTGNKTDFVTGDIDNRVVIIRSTPIELEEKSNLMILKTNHLHRCFSVPEEVVSGTDWVKRKRTKETVQFKRRWLSDCAIDRTSHNQLCQLSVSDNVKSRDSATSATVFRTNNTSIKESSMQFGESDDHFLREDTHGISVVIKEDEKSSLPIEEYFMLLPSQSCMEIQKNRETSVAASLFGGVSDVYSSELVLQGVTHMPQGWGIELQHTLLSEAHSGGVHGDVSESVCIVANTDTWEVLVVSSHSLMVSAEEQIGVKVGMSQLVGNILETTQHLCSLPLPAQLCLSHVETKLLELCVRSQALAELLLKSDFLDIATLTSVLDLDTNDVPLLLSVASTHTPLVTSKYGLSFQ